MVKFAWNLWLLYVVVVFLITCEGAYVPGQPGAQWTEQQAKITMEKILRLMYNPRKAISDIYNGKTLRQYDDLAAQARAYKGIQRNFENNLKKQNFFKIQKKHMCLMCIASTFYAILLHKTPKLEYKILGYFRCYIQS